ncbi:MAG: ribosome assembly cofactor RimP [Bacteroidales bacterium]|nr:ribosome assembly cofactor RimP [Candidatus Physcousia equi]
MIDKLKLERIVDEWMTSTDYFLVDLTVSADDRIVVVIDHAEGVWIEDCADLSRFIEERLSRDEEDYELEVGSAGLGQPFRVQRQYEIHVGKTVETQTLDGKKWTGTLLKADESSFTLLTQQKVKAEGAKRPKLVDIELELHYDEVAYTKYVIKIK